MVLEAAVAEVMVAVQVMVQAVEGADYMVLAVSAVLSVVEGVLREQVTEATQVSAQAGAQVILVVSIRMASVERVAQQQALRQAAVEVRGWGELSLFNKEAVLSCKMV